GEVTQRAEALTRELGTTIAPGFEALAFKASREIEDIYELTYICKDGSRFPAIVSITALRGDDDAIIGYLLIGTDNSTRKRVESGKLTLSDEPVELAEVISECQAMVEPQARSRGIQMAFPVLDTPRFIVADRTRVKQVLINILFNAIKYNRPEGRVTMEAMPA